MFSIFIGHDLVFITNSRLSILDIPLHTNSFFLVAFSPSWSGNSAGSDVWCWLTSVCMDRGIVIGSSADGMHKEFRQRSNHIAGAYLSRTSPLFLGFTMVEHREECREGHQMSTKLMEVLNVVVHRMKRSITWLRSRESLLKTWEYYWRQYARW